MAKHDLRFAFVPPKNSHLLESNAMFAEVEPGE